MASIPTQEEILAATRKSQETMIAVIRNWLETARTATVSVYAPLTDRLPRLPSVSLPFADKLPTPEEAVASAYDAAEQLLASQRRFTEELLKAMTPLMPGHGQSPAKGEVASRTAWQEAVTTSEPEPVAASAVSAPARPAAAEPAPRAKRTAADARGASATSARKSTATGSARKSTAAKTAPKPAIAKPAAASGAPKGTEAS